SCLVRCRDRLPARLPSVRSVGRWEQDLRQCTPWPNGHSCYGRASRMSAWIRCSVGGWVLKRDMTPPSDSGLMMNMCAVYGLDSRGTILEALSIFFKALTRPSGLPAIEAPPASASY